MRGVVEPSTQDVPRLWTPGPVPFDCSPFVNAESTTICQVSLPPSGYGFGLTTSTGSILSEFWNITQNDTGRAVQHGLSLYSTPMLVIHSHASAIRGGDKLNEKVTSLLSEGIWTNVSTPTLTWSVTLCFSAWDTAVLDVDMYSNNNRPEPILHWNNATGYYTEPSVHRQMSITDNSSHESRGILQLSPKPSWTPGVEYAIPNSVEPFVFQFADLYINANLQQEAPMSCSPCSALLLPPGSSALQIGYNRSTVFAIDYTLTTLFQQALGMNGTGSVASAVSMLVTTLSSMAYYDQMPQFERASATNQTYFATVLFPQSRLGYWAVMMVLAAHVGLVTVITFAYGAVSRYTLLGNHWQTITQLGDLEAKALFDRCDMSTDRELKKLLDEDGRNRVNVRLGADGTGRSDRAGRMRVVRDDE